MVLCEKRMFIGESLAESLRLAANWVEDNIGVYSIDIIETSVVLYQEV
jgi:hypothetical protein